jgi:hypothetical protein
MGLYLKHDLLDLDDETILDYLHYLKQKHKTPSDSFFKHTVYGLRYLYRIFERTESRVNPSQYRAAKEAAGSAEPGRGQGFIKSS